MRLQTIAEDSHQRRGAGQACGQMLKEGDAMDTGSVCIEFDDAAQALCRYLRSVTFKDLFQLATCCAQQLAMRMGAPPLR